MKIIFFRQGKGRGGRGRGNYGNQNQYFGRNFFARGGFKQKYVLPVLGNDQIFPVIDAGVNLTNRRLVKINISNFLRCLITVNRK